MKKIIFNVEQKYSQLYTQLSYFRYYLHLFVLVVLGKKNGDLKSPGRRTNMGVPAQISEQGRFEHLSSYLCVKLILLFRINTIKTHSVHKMFVLADITSKFISNDIPWSRLTFKYFTFQSCHSAENCISAESRPRCGALHSCTALKHVNFKK